ncbi:helix-turn-helix transcriptional regulator [Bradyrhizobium sp. WD16]|uniref:ArsR/SmtB family transcription factor n=1 Tax=Bradyrhizobium sp. WD16 TaxID=1521768 RepID=UPI0020A458CC|nr:metalloregulator ArsR/SmtB family transcription factor [Bradyrhizobium sp. WD16]UTD27600.1 transcriptional regulator [Bradyrhizobium sp. WD16]
MVYNRAEPLDRTFAALADPSRRALLARLEANDGLSVSELAKPLPMSLPAVMKHLDVLADAGLVTRRKQGRTVTCHLNAEPMREALGWLERYARFWREQLDRLATFLEEETSCPPPKAPPPTPSTPPLPSSVVSMPRPRRSSRPGPTRKN